ncbi:MAG: SulP family inorganic anion transporter [Cellvibrionales bacterium]|nr:SulP family inorganic anion transporter [Cellvibrionales bacterium]
MSKGYFRSVLQNLSSSMVVFLVAVPLCLGISLSSGVPLYAGLIAGIVGGIVVGSLSGSSLGVSGPAVGLCLVVLDSLSILGSYELLLLAIVIAGAIQLLLGFLSAGYCANYFPSCVVRGMLSGIGVMLLLKQIPLMLGVNKESVEMLALFQPIELSFFELFDQGILIVSLFSLMVYILWERWIKNLHSTLMVIPAPLVVIVSAAFFAAYLDQLPHLALSVEDKVNVPIADSFSGFVANFSFPDFSALANTQVYLCGLLIAMVASIETLLSADAIDKLDPLNRKTPPNRELKAQGVGNMVSGLIGGLPITQVIIRSSANCQSGATNKSSTIFHGFLLLFSILWIPSLLNFIPLAALSVILCFIGIKLINIPQMMSVFKQGINQSIPFFATIIGIALLGFLTGILLGVAVSLLLVLKDNLLAPHQVELRQKRTKITLSQNVSFLNKAAIQKILDELEQGVSCEINAESSYFIHPDVEEMLDRFRVSAKNRDIDVTFKGFANLS